jgi:hypothetical protein
MANILMAICRERTFEVREVMEDTRATDSIVDTTTHLTFLFVEDSVAMGKFRLSMLTQDSER